MLNVSLFYYGRRNEICKGIASVEPIRLAGRSVKNQSGAV